jgi:hypothetical protein
MAQFLDKTIFHIFLNYRVDAIRFAEHLLSSSLSNPAQCTLMIEDLRPRHEFRATSYIREQFSHNKMLINGQNF